MTPFVKPIVLAGSALTLLATFQMAVSYLSTNFISNSYATLFAMTSWLFHLGQPVYSSIQTQAPYSMPYGPYGYMIVSCFQQALGPSVFSSKLAPFLVTFGSLIFLYLALRTRLGWLGALALTALANTLTLPFEPLQYWPRPDTFLLFAISGGLWASTRREVWGPIMLGFFIGFAVDLKVHAFVPFLLPIAVAWRNNKYFGPWALAGLVAVVTAFLPFAWPNISILDYLRILKMDSNTMFLDASAIHYVEWCSILFLIGLSPLFANKWQAGETTASLWRNSDLWGPLLLSFLLESYPACQIGPNHLMPLIPVVIFLAAHFFADISRKPFLQRTPNWVGLSMVISVVLFTGLYALFSDVVELRDLGPKDILAKERIKDIEQIYNKRMPCVLLNASGSVGTYQDDYFYRVILLFNGMPVGIDPTASMDYKYFGKREPDLPSFIAELKSRYNERIVWICAKDTVPFSHPSYFAPYSPVFSDKFIDDFHHYFELSGHTACFDLYEEKSN